MSNELQQTNEELSQLGSGGLDADHIEAHRYRSGCQLTVVSGERQDGSARFANERSARQVNCIECLQHGRKRPGGYAETRGVSGIQRIPSSISLKRCPASAHPLPFRRPSWRSRARVRWTSMRPTCDETTASHAPQVSRGGPSPTRRLIMQLESMEEITVVSHLAKNIDDIGAGTHGYRREAHVAEMFRRPRNSGQCSRQRPQRVAGRDLRHRLPVTR